jgi:hypothetical protein
VVLSKGLLKLSICEYSLKEFNSRNIYEQTFVKTFMGYFHGNSKHLFGIIPKVRERQAHKAKGGSNNLKNSTSVGKTKTRN